jgi:hypothetical protein
MKRADYMSVGIAQVQFRYWLEYDEPIRGNNPFLYVQRFMNLNANYKVCHSYLEGRGVCSETALVDIAKVYVGATGFYYSRVLTDCHDWVIKANGVISNDKGR